MGTHGVAQADPKQVKEWLEQDAVLVDVREPDEHLREHISGSVLAPLSSFEPGEVADAGRVVLYCRSGPRSMEAAGRLAASGRDGVYTLAGGITGWKAAGLPVVERNDVPISIMRQVQIVAGGTVFVGAILGALVSPWLLILPAFFGAGLLFAGLSGTCGMAAMLRFMPWNKALRCDKAPAH
jgi:rhodanese-related sulfurtransferase